MRYALVRPSVHHMCLRVTVSQLILREDCWASDPALKPKKIWDSAFLIEAIQEMSSMRSLNHMPNCSAAAWVEKFEFLQCLLRHNLLWASSLTSRIYALCTMSLILTESENILKINSSGDLYPNTMAICGSQIEIDIPDGAIFLLNVSELKIHQWSLYPSQLTVICNNEYVYLYGCTIDCI